MKHQWKDEWQKKLKYLEKILIHTILYITEPNYTPAARMDLIQIIKEAWSGIQTGLRPMTALVPGCIIGARGGGIASVSGITQQYCRLKYMPLRHV
jgi:hypothetical protein